jgi:hypothetical protein
VDPAARKPAARVLVLPALDPAALAGLAPGEPLPAEGSNEEREAVHRLTKSLAEAVRPNVAALQERGESMAGRAGWDGSSRTSFDSAP